LGHGVPLALHSFPTRRSSDLAYLQKTNKQVHIALTKGTWNDSEPVLTRINSTLVNNDILGTLTNNPDEKLERMFGTINKEEKGADRKSTRLNSSYVKISYAVF